MNVSQAVDYRRSVRGFLDKPVDPALVKDIVERAARAASGGNLQPWHVDIVQGDSMARLKGIMAEKIANRESEMPEYAIYPVGLTDPWEGRRAEVGEMLYTSLNIPREDKKARAMWFARNFQFFGAPVGLFISLDRQMGLPQWADAGALLNSIMLLLCEAGLDRNAGRFTPRRSAASSVCPTTASCGRACRSATRTPMIQRTACAPTAHPQKNGWQSTTDD
jgi:nitroreductase